MIVERAWRIELREDLIELLEGGSAARILSRPGGRGGWEAALADARKLVQPAAAWELHPVKEILHERVVLQGGAHIGGGPVAAVAAGASELVVAVCTIGPGVGRRVQELQRERAGHAGPATGRPWIVGRGYGTPAILPAHGGGSGCGGPPRQHLPVPRRIGMVPG